MNAHRIESPRATRRPSTRTGLLAIAIGLGLLASAALVRGDVVVVMASRDNTLFQDAEGDTSNGTGPACFTGNNSQNLVRRALVRFEFAGLIPAGTVVDAVELTLEISSVPDEVARIITLHRALSDWGEGLSSSSGGGGAPATPGDATWLHRFFPGQPWATPGGDFASAASAATLVGDVGPYAWSGAGMTADLLEWLADPATNHGWLVRGEETGPRTVRRFDSREHADPARRPTLTLFCTHPVASRPTTWGRLKTLYR